MPVIGDVGPVENVEPVYPLMADRQGPNLRLWIDEVAVWAKITGATENVPDADGNLRTAYSWRKQSFGPGGSFVDSDDLVQGFTTFPLSWPAFTSGSRTLATGQVVRLYPAVLDKNPDPSVAHDLEWTAVEPDDPEVWLEVQHWARYDPGLGIGVPARIIRWAPGSTAPGGYAGARFAYASGTVRLFDANGNHFRPNEIVRAQFVEFFSGSGGSADRYVRSGLEAPRVMSLGSTAAYQEELGGLIGGFPSVREFVLREPLYCDHPYDLSSPGQARIHVVPAGGGAGGMLMGANASFSNDPYRESSLFQWPREGYTGFSTLLTNALVLSNGTAPRGTGVGAPDVPPDSAFLAWASGGTTELLSGGGRFDLIVDGGQGFVILAPGGTRGRVTWGATNNRYSSYQIYADEFHAGTGPVVPGVMSTSLSVEFGSPINSAFCWVGAPHHSNWTGIGDAYGSVVSQGAAGLLVTSSVAVTVGGTVNLGFGTFSNTHMIGQNWVAGGAFGELPGANYTGENFPPSSRLGAIFVNGIYVGGLDELLAALRPDPAGPSLHTPFLQIMVGFNPVTYVMPRMSTY